MEKFLSYSVIAAATFVGFVQLAVVVHGTPPGTLSAVPLEVAVLVLGFVVAGALSAAARQFFLISVLEGPRGLGIRELEKALTKGSAPLLANLLAYSHAAEEGASSGRTANLLSVTWMLLLGLLMLILLYALIA